jgi:hypothetical protein
LTGACLDEVKVVANGASVVRGDVDVVLALARRMRVLRHVRDCSEQTVEVDNAVSRVCVM